MNDSDKSPIRNYLEWSDEGKPAIWRYVLTITLGFVIWLWGSILPIVLVFGPLNIDYFTDPVATYYTFITGFIALPPLVWLLLGRPAYSLALPSWPSNLRDFGLGILIQWIAMGIMYAFMVKASYRGFDHFTVATIFTVILALVGIFIQTGFEEMLFRGLVAQATRRIIKWLPAVLLVQALWFASLHASNIEAFGGALWAWIPYLIPALTWGWIAWRTGSLVLPMAMHFAKNAFLWLFVTTEGDVTQGIAPFVAKIPAGIPSATAALRSSLGEFIITVIAILILEVILRRRAARATN